MAPRVIIHHNSRAGRAAARGEDGYVLLVFILFAALLVAGLSRILPKAVFEGQREKEEELIFRGLQYQRAVQLFVRKFGRYPSSVDELLETNELRFLRKAYKDPMTKDGEWRVIHVGPTGAFVDSINSPLGPAATPVEGLSPIQSKEESQKEAIPPGGVQSPGLTGSPGSQPGGVLPVDGSAPTPPPLSPSANPGGNPSQQPRVATNLGTIGSQPTPLSGTLGGGGIAGFASQSKESSIKAWKSYTSYDKWEFTYDYRQDPVAVAAIARTAAPQQQQPVQPPSGLTPGTTPPPPGGLNPRQPGFPRFPNSPGIPSQPRQPGAFPGPGGNAPSPFPISPIPGQQRR